MADVSEKTYFRAPLVKAWQVLAAAVLVTAGVVAAYLTKENERNLRDQEFRYQLLAQMKTFMTYASFNDWVDQLERKNPSLVLPRTRQAAVEEPTKNSFQAAAKGTSYAQ